MSYELREVVNTIDALHDDAAYISGDIDSLNEQLEERKRDLQQTLDTANAKLAELEGVLEEEFDAEQELLDEDEREEFFAEDDDTYRDMQKLVEDIDNWNDQANQ